MARGMVANVELFPSLCSVALDHIPPFLIKHFGINKETKAGQIPQHSAWKRCKTGVTIIMKGNQYPGKRHLDAKTVYQYLENQSHKVKMKLGQSKTIEVFLVLKFSFRLPYSA